MNWLGQRALSVNLGSIADKKTKVPQLHHMACWKGASVADLVFTAGLRHEPEDYAQYLSGNREASKSKSPLSLDQAREMKLCDSIKEYKVLLSEEIKEALQENKNFLQLCKHNLDSHEFSHNPRRITALKKPALLRNKTESALGSRFFRNLTKKKKEIMWADQFQFEKSNPKDEESPMKRSKSENLKSDYSSKLNSTGVKFPHVRRKSERKDEELNSREDLKDSEKSFSFQKSEPFLPKAPSLKFKRTSNCINRRFNSGGDSLLTVSSKDFFKKKISPKPSSFLNTFKNSRNPSVPTSPAKSNYSAFRISNYSNQGTRRGSLNLKNYPSQFKKPEVIQDLNFKKDQKLRVKELLASTNSQQIQSKKQESESIYSKQCNLLLRSLIQRKNRKHQQTAQLTTTHGMTEAELRITIEKGIRALALSLKR